jgi:uncharacterized protein YraI
MMNGWRLAAAAALVFAAPATAMAARGYATTTVNMRAGPGTDYPVVATIPDDAHLNIHGCLSDHDWCDVTWSSNRGWVSSHFLDYFYRGHYVYLPSYYEEIDVPVVTFALGSYWDNYYRGRPWYRRLGHWEGVWRDHGRYGEGRHAGDHRHAGLPGAPHRATGPVISGAVGNHGMQNHPSHGNRLAHEPLGNGAGRAHFAHFGHDGGAAHLGVTPGGPHGAARLGEMRGPAFANHHNHAQFGGRPGFGSAPHAAMAPRPGGGPGFAAHAGGIHVGGGAPHVGGGPGAGATAAAHAQMGGGPQRRH